MADYQLGTIEARFADIIWNSEPIQSSALAAVCAEEFGWKKSTTYTVLKRLIDKGIFKNEKGVVSSVMSRADFYSAQSGKYVDDAFSGSLPAFLAAFTAKKKLSAEEIDSLRKIVKEYEENM